MLTELENYSTPFDSQNSFVPCTIDDIENSEELTVENFFEIPGVTEKIDTTLNAALITYSGNPESHDSSSMNSSPVDDLLNLEDYQGSWRTDSNDPDWTPDNYQSLLVAKTSRKPQNLTNTSQCKASKRRSSSSTTESDILIEIEESTKRAKRCTANLTEEEKRLRRKELNRLAAQRCRNKRKGHAEELEEEIEELTAKNKELKERLEHLTTTKDELYEIIKFHFSNCHGKSA